MIPRELARKIRYIQIHTKKAVNDVLAGEYGSVFKGRGMQFNEVREYQPGDEVRAIDWNVTARTGHPYVKQYIEEREMTVLFLVDLSASGTFGSVEKKKSEVAAEFCAMVAFSAIRNSDKVGLLVFTDHIEMFIPPKKGTSHVLRLIRELLSFSPQRARTDIAIALEYLGRVQHKRGVVFLVSDFFAGGFEKQMAIVARRHDLVAVSIADPRELALPNVGMIALEDAETGEKTLLDTASASVRSLYAQEARKRQKLLSDLFARMHVDHIPLQTGDDYVRDLVRFFKSRERRRE